MHAVPWSALTTRTMYLGGIVLIFHVIAHSNALEITASTWRHAEENIRSNDSGISCEAYESHSVSSAGLTVTCICQSRK